MPPALSRAQIAVICTPIFCKKNIDPIVQEKALINGVNDEIIELIDESSILSVDSVNDLINILFSALITVSYTHLTLPTKA